MAPKKPISEEEKQRRIQKAQRHIVIAADMKDYNMAMPDQMLPVLNRAPQMDTPPRNREQAVGIVDNQLNRLENAINSSSLLLQPILKQQPQHTGISDRLDKVEMGPPPSHKQASVKSFKSFQDIGIYAEQKKQQAQLKSVEEELDLDITTPPRKEEDPEDAYRQADDEEEEEEHEEPMPQRSQSPDLQAKSAAYDEMAQAYAELLANQQQPYGIKQVLRSEQIIPQRKQSESDLSQRSHYQPQATQKQYPRRNRFFKQVGAGAAGKSAQLQGGRYKKEDHVSTPSEGSGPNE